MKFFYALIFASITIISCQNTPEPEKILFNSTRNGNSDIFLMDSTGVIIKQVTNSPLEEWAPVWINDHEISFLRQVGNEFQRIKLDMRRGTETVIPQPGECTLSDKNALYDPFSKRQMFYCNGEVYLKENEEALAEQLTVDISGMANYASWTNKEDVITFTSNHQGNNEIYFFNLKTKELENLSNHPANDERGEVSGDGKFIVFSTSRYEGGNQDIALMDLETKEVKRLTKGKGLELIARWSRDDKTIYYGSNKDGNWEVYAYHLPTGQSKNLTDHSMFDGDPRVQYIK